MQLYVLMCKDKPKIKVGISANVMRRLGEIANTSGNVFDFERSWLYSFDDPKSAKRLEGLLKLQFHKSAEPDDGSGWTEYLGVAVHQQVFDVIQGLRSEFGVTQVENIGNRRQDQAYARKCRRASRVSITELQFLKSQQITEDNRHARVALNDMLGIVDLAKGGTAWSIGESEHDSGDWSVALHLNHAWREVAGDEIITKIQNLAGANVWLVGANGSLTRYPLLCEPETIFDCREIGSGGFFQKGDDCFAAFQVTERLFDPKSADLPHVGLMQANVRAHSAKEQDEKPVIDAFDDVKTLKKLSIADVSDLHFIGKCPVMRFRRIAERAVANRPA